MHQLDNEVYDVKQSSRVDGIDMLSRKVGNLTNHQSTLGNLPEDRRLYIHPGGSLKSRKVWQKFTVVSEERAISFSRWNKILKMEVGSFCETLINFYQIARRYALQESGLHLFSFSFCSSVFFSNLGLFYIDAPCIVEFMYCSLTNAVLRHSATSAHNIYLLTYSMEQSPS